MLTLIKQHAKRVIWVNTTPVPLSVTEGPERHNADVLAFNDAAGAVTSQLQIATADVYSAVMEVRVPLNIFGTDNACFAYVYYILYGVGVPCD